MLISFFWLLWCLIFLINMNILILRKNYSQITFIRIKVLHKEVLTYFLTLTIKRFKIRILQRISVLHIHWHLYWFYWGQDWCVNWCWLPKPLQCPNNRLRLTIPYLLQRINSILVSHFSLILKHFCKASLVLFCFYRQRQYSFLNSLRLLRWLFLLNNFDRFYFLNRFLLDNNIRIKIFFAWWIFTHLAFVDAVDVVWLKTINETLLLAIVIDWSFYRVAVDTKDVRFVVVV